MKKQKAKKIAKEQEKIPFFERELQTKNKELLEQSEQISKLLSEIGKLNVKIQNLENLNQDMRERLAFSQGHIREKENKLNMIKSILSK